MERIQTEAVYISNVVNDSHTEQYTSKDENDDWQDLEQFWGFEKHRFHIVDGQESSVLSSSLEKHLLHDDFLKEPKHDSTNTKIVKGADIKDIPTSYITSGFRPQELIVIGTYVHKDVMPGFRYKVRKNLTDEYLFDGKAKYLESIGLGYGKRLTFEGESLNDNQNFFWSDSRSDGYGFLFQTVEKEEEFSILDTKTESVIGRVIVSNPSMTEDVVLSSIVGERGYVEKKIKVHFSCNVILHGTSNIFMENVEVQGTSEVVRINSSSKAKISQIFLSEFVADSCLLFPED